MASIASTAEADGIPIRHWPLTPSFVTTLLPNVATKLAD
jgi:hypothetical protein